MIRPETNVLVEQYLVFIYPPKSVISHFYLNFTDSNNLQEENEELNVLIRSHVVGGRKSPPTLFYLTNFYLKVFVMVIVFYGINYTHRIEC